ncbi:hypothetical protein BFJ69_g10721 [Fusarium oxysporum]|uniref:Uncharacterized protein n=1 Tax=Fusarium oxysporum TaxID=5507 RepID=A0A420MUG0_FUSOX|nr:hypothetical protein BFJ69_g10721 [Fusarium oxysporum]
MFPRELMTARGDINARSCYKRLPNHMVLTAKYEGGLGQVTVELSG